MEAREAAVKTVSAPSVLLACLLLGLPLGGLRDPMLWTAFAAFIWVLALLSAERGEGPSMARRFKPWLPWLAWALLSLLASGQPLKGLFPFSRWLTLLVFFSLASAAWRDADSRRWLAVLASAAAVLGLATLVVPNPVHPRMGLIPPYYNYTVFVEAALAAAVLAAVGHRDGPRGWKAWALAAVGVFCAAMMVLARSRGGVVAVAAASGLWAWRRGLQRPLLWAGLGLALAAALAPPWATSFFLKLDLSAWFTRPEIWRSALKVIADHPIAGEGLGNFEVGFLRHNFPKHWATNYGFIADHAHSEVLEMAAETGLAGLALFAWGLWETLRGQGIRDSSAREAGAYAALAMAVQCVYDNMLHLPGLAMLFFTSLACARAEDVASGKDSGPGLDSPWASPRRLLWRGFCAAGLVLSLTAWIPRWMVEYHAALARHAPDPARRVESLTRAVRIFPADASLREGLAAAWMSAAPSMPGRALAEIETARRLSPTNALLVLLQAEILLDLSSRPDAHPAKAAEAGAVLRLLDRAVELEPNFLGARLLRAELWARAGESNAAWRELSEIRQRRASLQGGRLYTAYDDMIVSCDPARFEAVRGLAALDRRPRRVEPVSDRRRGLVDRTRR